MQLLIQHFRKEIETLEKNELLSIVWINIYCILFIIACSLYFMGQGKFNVN